MIRRFRLVLQREIDAFLHVRNDDQRAHGRREIVVRIALEVHVLGEVFRLHQFADVVEIGANAAKRRVGADRFRGGFREVRDDQTVMIGARRLDRHAAQQRMIEIGRFQPGDIGRDLKEMFEDRQDAAHDRGRDDAVADGERALNADHLPVVRARRKEIDRPDEAEGERQEPDGDANAETGPNQPAPPANLEREINGGKSADQSANQQRRVDFAKQNAAPKTDENRSVEAVVAPEQAR